MKQQRIQKEKEARATIYEQLVMSGEKQRLKEILKKRLIESGWREEVKLYAKRRLFVLLNKYSLFSLFSYYRDIEREGCI
jgi:hypothetical protein